jgi:hypothetical protein
MGKLIQKSPQKWFVTMRASCRGRKATPGSLNAYVGELHSLYFQRKLGSRFRGNDEEIVRYLRKA